MPYVDYPAGPLRDAYIAGATAEAERREAPRRAADPDVRQLLEYADAIVEHDTAQAASIGALLASLGYVFHSALTRAERRAIRRAIRGVMP